MNTSIGFKYDSGGSTLLKFVDGLEKIISSEFNRALKRKINNQANNARLTKTARSVINESIYSFDEGSYVRTDSLKDSFKAAPTEGEIGNTVYSDPAVADALRAGPNDSYAIFFESPIYKSFLPDSADRPRIRPFMNKLTDAVEEENVNCTLDSIIKIFRSRLVWR